MFLEESPLRPHAACAMAQLSRRASAVNEMAGQQLMERRLTSLSSLPRGQSSDETQVRSNFSVHEPLEFALLDLALSPTPPSPAELSCALSLDDLLTASDSSELSEHETQLLLQNGVAPWDNAPEVTRSILLNLRRESLKATGNFGGYAPGAWTVPNVLDDTRGHQWPSRNAPECTASMSSSVTAAPAVASPRLRRNVSVSEMSQWDG